MVMYPMMQLDPAGLLILRDEAGYIGADFQERSPVPTCNSFVTKDGQWVQLLGAEPRRHFGNTYDAFSQKTSVIMRMIAAAVLAVPGAIANKLRGQDPRKGLVDVLRVLNTTLRDEIGKRNWADLHQLLDKHNVWHCRVRSPGQLLLSRQAHDTATFRRDVDGTGCLIVAAPAQFVTAPSQKAKL